MNEVYWGCLIGGVIFTVVALLLGDILGGHGDVGHPDVGSGDASVDGAIHDVGTGHDGWHLDFLKPAVIVGAITAFGGAGIMLSRYASLSAGSTVAFAVAIAAVIGAGVYLLYVRPLRHAESSVGYSMADLAGRTCDVLVSIPAQGFGEVMVRIGNGVVNHIATSDGVLIPRGSRGVVVAVENGVLVVAPFEADLLSPQQPPQLPE